MAQFTITIPDAVLPRLLNAIAANRGYDPASGLTKAQFARQWLRTVLRQEVRDYESSRDANATRDASATTADADTEPFQVT